MVKLQRLRKVGQVQKKERSFKLEKNILRERISNKKKGMKSVKP